MIKAIVYSISRYSTTNRSIYPTYTLQTSIPNN